MTNSFPYQVCAGQQESGSVCISSRGNDGEITFREWHPGGHYRVWLRRARSAASGDCLRRGTQPEVSKYNIITGQVQNVTPIPVRSPEYRADRTEPILFSPVDPHLMFYAANVLFETRDYGKTLEGDQPRP